MFYKKLHLDYITMGGTFTTKGRLRNSYSIFSGRKEGGETL
jgi:hypothetical protein